MRRIVVIALSVFLLGACSGNISRDIPPLLHSVPSRSLAVMHFPHCSNALEFLLDSTSVFRQIDYGRLDEAEMVLSYDYSAALVPLLAIDAGRADADTSQAVRKILSQAEEIGLHALYTGNNLPKRAALLLSPSRPSIDEAWSHIESGASILDAPGFKDAVSTPGNSSARIMLKNESASRWIPAKLLKEFFARKDLVRFTSGAAEWTVMDLDGESGEGIVMRPYTEGKKKYLAEMFASVPAAEMKLGDVVPDTLDMVICLPLKDCKAYCEAWKECLDVRAGLSRYKGRLASLKKSSGKHPETWMVEQDIKEVARVCWDGHEIMLFRSAHRKRNASPAAEANPYPGFIPALFGEAFRIADESYVLSQGHWTAVGSEADLCSWLDACRDNTASRLPKKAKYYFETEKFSLMADNKNIITNVN